MNKTGVARAVIVLAALALAATAHSEWTTTGPSWVYASGELDEKSPADCEHFEVVSYAAGLMCQARTVINLCTEPDHLAHSGLAVAEACGWYVHSKSSPMDPEPVPGAANASCTHSWGVGGAVLEDAEAHGNVLLVCGGNGPTGGSYNVTYDLQNQGWSPAWVSQTAGGDVYDDDWSRLGVLVRASLEDEDSPPLTWGIAHSTITVESFDATCGPADPPDPPGPPGP